MKRFLAILIGATSCSLCTYAQNGYIVTTTSQQTSISVESLEKQFINDHFKYYNLCDWTPGMKFMVMPERKDIIIPPFKSAETNKEVDTGELKHKIFEYLGSEITERGFVHFNFECEGQQYYHELKNTTLEQYCLKPKAGIPTLAYLGDVDIAKELLEGQTLYMLEQVWGPKRFLSYYMVCGIGAGLVQELVQYIQYVTELSQYDSVNTGIAVIPMAEYLNLMTTVGASGAIYGILLAFGMLFPNSQMFVFPIPFPVKAKYFVMGYAALEIFLGLGASTDGVAHFAHLGGMIFGFILIMYWRKKNNNGQFYY